MAFYKVKCQRFKTAKGLEDIQNLNCYFGCMKSKAHNFFVPISYIFLYIRLHIYIKMMMIFSYLGALL